ncbi:MAG: hypothetical protein V8Q30_13730, partial [Acutalibacteraceae bacterium]
RRALPPVTATPDSAVHACRRSRQKNSADQGGTVYLLEVGKTLDLDVPIFGTPSIKTLGSDRISVLA